MKTILLLPLLFSVALNLAHGQAADPTASTTANASPNASLASSNADSADISATSTLEQLRALVGARYEPPTFLQVDDAFQLEINGVGDGQSGGQLGNGRIDATFTIADGYYLYRDKIAFSSDVDARLVDAVLPPGEIKTDPYFGEIAVFKHNFSAPISLQRATADATQIRLRATYQGCAEEGICYAPVSKTFALDLPAIAGLFITSAFAAEGVPAEAATNNSATAGWPSMPSLLLGAFLAGLLLTFTPCVLPMLPILSSVIAGQGEGLTRRKGGILALGYVLGTVVSYAAIGALAGATGLQLQAYLQNIWAIGIFAAVLVIMALSMFGIFTIQMPTFIQSAIQSAWQQKSRKMRDGLSGNRGNSLIASLPFAFLLGAVSAVIIGACVSPVLISLLSIAISAGDPWLGACIMAGMAFGMGIPLLALGLGASHWLPKVGKWMDAVSHLFGIMLIGVAIYLLGVLPEVPVLLLWGAFLVIVGVYLGATRQTPAAVSGWRIFIKGVGMVMLIWGSAALIGGFFGERNLLKPLPAGLFSSANERLDAPRDAQPATKSAAHFIRVGNLAELDAELARAAGENKLVMLDYYADWCVDCVRMQKTTFRDARVLEVLNKNFITLKIDVTDARNENAQALKKRYAVFGPPALLFFDRNGNELTDYHSYGYRNSTDFHALLTALSG